MSTDFVEDPTGNPLPADMLDLNTRPTTGPSAVAEISWLGADRYNFVKKSLGDLRNQFLAGLGLIVRSQSSLRPSTSGQVSYGNVNGQAAKNENGGPDVGLERYDQLSRSASAGAYAPAIKANTAVEMTLDADLTLNNAAPAGFASSSKSGVHLVLMFKQDSTGGRMVTWGANYRCAFLQPKQGPNQTSSIHLMQRADGTWQLVSHDAINIRHTLHVEDFGLVFDGTTDCISFIQAAIDFSIYKCGSLTKPIVLMPPGAFNISRPVQVCYGEGQHSCQFEGAGGSVRGIGQIGGTALICTYSNAPGICVSGGLGVRVRKIAVVGKLVSWITNNNFGCSTELNSRDPLIDDTVAANWVDPDLDANQDSRYAPYAGLAVDPYSVTTRPTPSYPDVPYPSYTGIGTQYSKGLSSDVLFDEVYVYGFNTGFVVQPGGGDGNGDFVKFRNCLFDCVKWVFSVGHTQSRNVDIQNCQAVFFYSCFTDSTHGLGLGRFGGTVTDLALGAGINIFTLGSTAYTGAMTFNNFYAEAIWRIGDYNPATSNECMLEWNQGTFSFSLQNNRRGIPGKLLAAQGGGQISDMRFSGCQFANYPSVCYFSPVGLLFDGCRFHPDQFDGTTPGPYQSLGYNFTAGGLVQGRLNPGGVINQTFAAYNADDNSGAGVARENLSGRPTGTPYYAKRCQPSANGQWDDSHPNPQIGPQTWDKSDAGTFTSITLSGREVTLVFAALPDWLAMRSGMEPGDVWLDYDTGTVFYVRSRSGNTVIGVAQNNYKLVSSVETVQGFVANTGTLYACVSRFYTPAYPLIGDIEAVNGVMKNAGRADGYAGGIAEIQAGDWLFIVQELESWSDQTQPIVGSVDATAKTLTLGAGGIFYKAETRKRFPWLIRKPPANV